MFRSAEVTYEDYRHFQAFAEALHADENALDATTDVQSPGPPPSPAPSGRVRKVSALSDFAPVNVRVSRRCVKHTVRRRSPLTRHTDESGERRCPGSGATGSTLFFDGLS